MMVWTKILQVGYPSSPTSAHSSGLVRLFGQILAIRIQGNSEQICEQELVVLQVHLHDNDLSQLPPVLCEMLSLQKLVLSRNKMVSLPDRSESV
jgi:hypothetical protein